MVRAHIAEFEGKVRYSEIVHRAAMTLPALINYFQDCSTFQSEQLGYGMDVLKKEKKAWVLAYWQVIVKRYPKLCEKITVGTFASGFKGMFGNRNFYMKDESGEQIACANSIWVYMDVEKGIWRPCCHVYVHVPSLRRLPISSAVRLWPPMLVSRSLQLASP